MRVIAYVRVSSSEQAKSGLGLDAQRRAILSEAQRRGWTEADIEWIDDAGFSAKSMNRPGLTFALESLRRGDADVLVVAKQDRLSRSMLDFTSIMDKAQRQGWALIALDCAMDTTTPAGEAMANVMATFAQLERRLIGERTAAALAEAKERGVQLGRPRTLSEDVVARILSEHADGASYNAIAKRLDADDVPTAQGGKWASATVRKVVLSRS